MFMMGGGGDRILVDSWKFRVWRLGERFDLEM